MDASDETSITEITIGPDGRVYVFGLSREVLSVLAELCPGDPVVEDRMNRLAMHETFGGGMSANEPAHGQPPRVAVRQPLESTPESSP